MTKVEKIGKAFCRNLKNRYDDCVKKRVQPKGVRWLKSLLVFTSLEACRKHVGVAARRSELFCRFTIGTESKKRPFGKEEKELRTYLTKERAINDILDRPLEKLSEWITDFSFSYGTIEQAYGNSKQKSPEGPFELLLTAESELNGGQADVMEDLLRLFFVKSPIRVMIFRGGVGELGHLIQEMFTVHRISVDSDWLFLGIPIYAEWYEHRVNKKDVAVFQCFSLAKGDEPANLTAHADWVDGLLDS